MSRTHQWIVVADARTATMYRCRATPGGKWNLDAVASLTNSHEQEHARGRPAELSGHGPGRAAHGAPHLASPGHGADEELHRFAREVAGADSWLARLIREQHAEHVHVFAAAPLLGALRQVMETKGALGGGTIRDNATFAESELANLTPGHLATHPKVLAALGSAAQ
jgi:protein required for attachment to host cells